MAGKAQKSHGPSSGLYGGCPNGTSKKRPSIHLHKVPSRCNKVSPRTLQTALVCTYVRVFVCARVRARTHPLSINQATNQLNGASPFLRS
jgi:hypothetical protein